MTRSLPPIPPPVGWTPPISPIGQPSEAPRQGREVTPPPPVNWTSVTQYGVYQVPPPIGSHPVGQPLPPPVGCCPVREPLPPPTGFRPIAEDPHPSVSQSLLTDFRESSIPAQVGTTVLPNSQSAVYHIPPPIGSLPVGVPLPPAIGSRPVGQPLRPPIGSQPVGETLSPPIGASPSALVASQPIPPPIGGSDWVNRNIPRIQ